MTHRNEQMMERIRIANRLVYDGEGND